MSMNVKVCAFCNKMFKYKGNALCGDCLKRIDDDYTVVRDYLYDHPSASIQELSKETDVDEKVILHLIRNHRLEFAQGTDTGVYCSSCGKSITQGTMCDKCKNKMSDMLRSALPPEMRGQGNGASSERNKGRMHTSDRHDER